MNELLGFTVLIILMIIIMVWLYRSSNGLKDDIF